MKGPGPGGMLVAAAFFFAMLLAGLPSESLAAWGITAPWFLRWRAGIVGSVFALAAAGWLRALVRRRAAILARRRAEQAEKLARLMGRGPD